MNEKIGIGITTFERFDIFKKCFESVLKCSKHLDYILVVDDCSVKDREKYDEYFENLIPTNKVEICINEENLGVGKSKNKILEKLYARGCNYLFTIEDDIEIKNPDVFNIYINCAHNNEIEYLNFAGHGPYKDIPPIKCTNGVALREHLTGAFSLHTRKLIDEIGYYDDEYINAMEHVDYYYMASKKGLVTPFWYFADVDGSEYYLEELTNSTDGSIIRDRPDWAQNMVNARKYFKEKHGIDFKEIPK